MTQLHALLGEAGDLQRGLLQVRDAALSTEDFQNAIGRINSQLLALVPKAQTGLNGPTDIEGASLPDLQAAVNNAIGAALMVSGGCCLELVHQTSLPNVLHRLLCACHCFAPCCPKLWSPPPRLLSPHPFVTRPLRACFLTAAPPGRPFILGSEGPNLPTPQSDQNAVFSAWLAASALVAAAGGLYLFDIQNAQEAIPQQYDLKKLNGVLTGTPRCSDLSKCPLYASPQAP